MSAITFISWSTWLRGKSFGRSPAGGPGRILLTLLTLSVVAGAGGCTAESEPVAVGPTATTYTAESQVIQPGRPGEVATTLAPGQTARRPQDPGWNAADLSFVSMMIDHHTQALRMAGLAPGRAADPKVLAVAERVRAAQAPEIQAMKAWLAARGRRGLPTGANKHAGHGARMPGEVSAASLTSLSRATGAAFDTLFLDLMIEHHAGAVQMSSEVTTTGTDLTVQEIAAETAVGQNAEIRRMEELRRTL